MVVILGIDVGTVNLGWAVVKDGKFYAAGVAKLQKKVPLKTEIRRFARALKFKYGPFTIVAIEKQMRARMRVAETHLANEFGTVAKIVTPQAIKRYFGYSGVVKYRDRKIIGVRIFQNLCRETCQLQWLQGLVKKANKAKLDDVADAGLIAYHEYSEYKPEKEKKKKEDDNFINKWFSSNVWCCEDSKLDSLPKRIAHKD